MLMLMSSFIGGNDFIPDENSKHFRYNVILFMVQFLINLCMIINHLLGHAENRNF